MEVARHDSLADQLLELHALEEARLASEEEARLEAELAAKQHAEAEAERRREQEEEARRQVEARALAEAEAKREAEERRALEALEVELRRRLEQEAKGHAAELRSELERESHAKIEEGLGEAKKRTRVAMAATAVVLLVSAGVYGWVVAPRIERQTLEIERARQEAQLLQRENESLVHKVQDLEQSLESMKLEPPEPTPTPTQRRPRQRPEKQRQPQRDPLENPACDENDPLCGI